MTTLHHCDAPLETPYDGYGSAIDSCSSAKDDTLWAGNGEYWSQINYCPFCGYKATVPIVGKT